MLGVTRAEVFLHTAEGIDAVHYGWILPFIFFGLPFVTLIWWRIGLFMYGCLACTWLWFLGCPLRLVSDWLTQPTHPGFNAFADSSAHRYARHLAFLGFWRFPLCAALVAGCFWLLLRQGKWRHNTKFAQWSMRGWRRLHAAVRKA